MAEDHLASIGRDVLDGAGTYAVHTLSRGAAVAGARAWWLLEPTDPMQRAARAARDREEGLTAQLSLVGRRAASHAEERRRSIQQQRARAGVGSARYNETNVLLACSRWRPEGGKHDKEHGRLQTALLAAHAHAEVPMSLLHGTITDVRPEEGVRSMLVARDPWRVTVAVMAGTLAYAKGLRVHMDLLRRPTSDPQSGRAARVLQLLRFGARAWAPEET